MSLSELAELAERCEQATEPDRLLDGEIWRAAHGLTVYDVLTPEGDISVSVPAVTASLDAAMTLVPEGWNVSLHANASDQSRATVSDAENAGRFSYGATPALALCAAALKARAHD